MTAATTRSRRQRPSPERPGQGSRSGDAGSDAPIAPGRGGVGRDGSGTQQSVGRRNIGEVGGAEHYGVGSSSVWAEVWWRPSVGRRRAGAHRRDRGWPERPVGGERTGRRRRRGGRDGAGAVSATAEDRAGQGTDVGEQAIARDEAFEAELAGLIGKPVSSRGPTVAPDPVNEPMIRHWAAAFEDWNPVYTDPEGAAASRFGGIVAPPLMLQTWTMATPQITGIAARGGSPVASDTEAPLLLLDRAGYTATLATNSEFDIVRYLRPGDVVSAGTVFESISEEKATRMGPGRFITWVTTYTDQQGEVVGHQRFRILKFDPSRAS